MKRTLNRIRHRKLESKHPALRVKVVTAKSDSKSYTCSVNSATMNNQFPVFTHHAQLCAQLSWVGNSLQRLAAKCRRTIFYISTFPESWMEKEIGNLSLYLYCSDAYRNTICQPNEMN